MSADIEENISGHTSQVKTRIWAGTQAKWKLYIGLYISDKTYIVGLVILKGI